MNDRPPNEATRALPASTRGELRRLGWVLGALAIASAITYAHPALARFRPWTTGEAVPLAGLFRGWERLARGGGASTDSAAVPAAVLANMGTTDTQASAPPADGPDGAQIAPEEYAGIDATIEDPSGHALDAFFTALARSARGEAGAITRIAHYGDSSIATDLITHTVRRRLQQRFGDAGHGFVLVARGTMPYQHRDIITRASDAWELRQVVMNEDPREGLYGYGGVHFRAQSGAYAQFATTDEGPVGHAVSRFEVFFQRTRANGSVRVQVDSGAWQAIDTGGGEGAGFGSIEVPDGAHTFTLRPSGANRLYGVVFERAGPGVVYDSLGLVGARAKRLLAFNQTHIAEQIAHRNVNLLALGFGGNEAEDTFPDFSTYEEDYIQVIRRMRAGRSCLVVSPLDQAYRNDRGNVVTFPNIPQIVEAQRRAARREGCAFYDTFRAMGGEGAMRRWWNMRPHLALSDFRHATPAGYEAIGNMFYKALLRAFAERSAAQR